MSLKYHMSLKIKYNISIKGPGCSDIRPQQASINKEDRNSTTVAIYSLMLACIIDAQERWKTATVDITGEFMHANMENLVHVKF